MNISYTIQFSQDSVLKLKTIPTRFELTIVFLPKYVNVKAMQRV